jgi:ribosomal protein L17
MMAVDVIAGYTHNLIQGTFNKMKGNRSEVNALVTKALEQSFITVQCELKFNKIT